MKKIDWKKWKESINKSLDKFENSINKLMDKFWEKIVSWAWKFLIVSIGIILILLGYNLRIHDNEKYVSRNAELKIEIEEFKEREEILSGELIKAILELDEYIEIINNLQEHPLALEIIKCESDFNANAHNKETDDWSYWQINDYWHREPAKKRGYDIENPKENLQYGFEKYLEMNGLVYWNPSKHCWAETKTNEGEKKNEIRNGEYNERQNRKYN